jgi:hypothetical protein
MTQDEIIEMAMEAEFVLHGKPSEEESELFVCVDKDIVRFAKLVASKEREALAQTQEPVAWMDADGNVSDNNDHNCFPIPLYTTPPQRTEQEPVAFAGIEMWIGNTRIKKLMTQAELIYAIDPWAIIEFNSDSCIDALREKDA